MGNKMKDILYDLKKMINCKLGENKISIHQIDKTGEWRCSELTIYCDDIFEGIAQINGVGDAMNCVLRELNKPLGENELE